MEDTYRTLKGPCEGLFKAKGSKHFGYGFPIASEDDVKIHLSHVNFLVKDTVHMFLPPNYLGL